MSSPETGGRGGETGGRGGETGGGRGETSGRAGRIRVLPPETVALIAAGEVVERPASVVRELVENSLDAGARRVDVILERGACSVTVADDGCGMTPEELRLAVQRHATSKIAAAEDLLALGTLGFRGEALPSIAAVSRLELVSRPAGRDGGWRLVLRGGVVEEEGPAACGAGTRVRVTELFFNTPARLKHLRSPAWEVERCLAAVAALLLAFPHVSFRVWVDGRQVLAAGGGHLRAAAAAVLGREVAARLLPVAATEGAWSLDGFVAPPDLARAGRRHLHFVVNGRPALAHPLGRAVEQAYRGLLPGGRYPVGVLRLTLPPAEVDANVHPAKAVVRLQEEDRAFRFVLRAVRVALEGARLVAAFAAREGAWPARVAEAAVAYRALPLEEGGEAPGEGGKPTAAGTGAEGGEGRQAEVGGRWPALRYLGQVAGTFLLAEGEDGLYLIDQHAAHERVRYEEYLDRLAAGGEAAQVLAAPLPVRVGAGGVAAWREADAALRRMGFVAEEFGPDALLLRAAPPWAATPDEAFLAALDRMADGPPGAPEEAAGGEGDAERLARVAMASCRSSVRGGDRLSAAEAASLLAMLAGARNPFTCPHGRPTTVRLTHADLERLFLRS